MYVILYICNVIISFFIFYKNIFFIFEKFKSSQYFYNKLDK